MPRFLTPEWADAITAALAGKDLPGPGPDDGLTASGGRFVVAEEVRAAPDGDVRLVLRVDGGTVTLGVAPLAGDPGADEPQADVTIALDYGDAVAMADGSLSPAEALTGGRVRVRGDLSVLTAGQQLLAAAREHTAAVDAETTF